MNDDDDTQEYVIYQTYEKHYRNQILEEVAKEFDSMKAFGDTSASFAAFVRGMKR
jgi:hypothetical protein